MKQPVLMIFCIFLLSACSAYNRIQTSEINGLKKMFLAQTLEVNLLNGKTNLTDISTLKVNTAYLYQERAGQRPVVTLDIKIKNRGEELADSSVFFTLDGENVKLPSSKGRYIIAENLWIPLVHSKVIQYQLNTKPDVLVLSLNTKQKSQLTEFFNKAIKHRDVIFPAIPPGQKKW